MGVTRYPFTQANLFPVHSHCANICQTSKWNKRTFIFIINSLFYNIDGYHRERWEIKAKKILNISEKMDLCINIAMKKQLWNWQIAKLRCPNVDIPKPQARPNKNNQRQPPLESPSPSKLGVRPRRSTLASTGLTARMGVNVPLTWWWIVSRGWLVALRVTIRCRDDGLCGHLRKTNMLLAIAREHATAQQDVLRWLEILKNGGTTTTRFSDFIQRIINNIGPGTPQRHRCFAMDNLNAHRNLIVQQIIHNIGHSAVVFASYHPVDRLIEYYFNHMQMSLTLAMHQLESLVGVQSEVRAILRGTIGNANLFEIINFCLGIHTK